MEQMSMKKQTSFHNPTSTPSALGIHKDSHSISKVKPKIRIIHIFAPEIIKTDVANFRELVQRLTGKPAENNCNKKNSASVARRSKDETVQKSSVCHDKRIITREKLNNKDEESLWQGENSSTFLGGFGEFDGFMQDFGEFPLFPMDSSHTQDFQENHRLA